ncbi:MAG: epimerase [Candidatus Firestonebacteria bacterium]|nr:epimerase [Candidatus Firestonebacteria bacterium]
MNYKDIRTDAELNAFMTSPSLSLIRTVGKIKGDIIGLGATGKMGLELMQLILNADKAAGRERKYYVASTFSNPDNIIKLENLGIKTYKGDLSDSAFLKKLPEAKNVYYMAGFKFGTSMNYQRAYHMNIIMPYLVGEKFKNSNITCFSTTNLYPKMERKIGGAVEDTPIDPQGIYGWTVVGRENTFNIISEKYGTKVALYRLAYAQHLYYGVLVDIAKMLKTEKTITLMSNYVNLISQRDANEVAIKSLTLASNPPRPINCCGPIVDLKELIEKMAKIMGKKVKVVKTPDKAGKINCDSFSVKKFGAYRDKPEEMLEAAVHWVKNGGKDWNKPTGFLSNHKY